MDQQMQGVGDQDCVCAQDESAQAISSDEAFDSVACQDDEWLVSFVIAVFSLFLRRPTSCFLVFCTFVAKFS
jgi:hypothetical protein